MFDTDVGTMYCQMLRSRGETQWPWLCLTPFFAAGRFEELKDLKSDS